MDNPSYKGDNPKVVGVRTAKESGGEMKLEHMPRRIEYTSDREVEDVGHCWERLLSCSQQEMAGNDDDWP